MRACVAAALALAVVACTDKPGSPVCGLHSAGAPVTLRGDKERTLSVGAKLLASDRISAKGPTLLECFGGALKVLDGDKVQVGDLKEALIEATTVPRYVLKDKKPVEVEAPPIPAVALRYNDSRFTPESALSAGGPTSGDYLKAFFTPNGIENMQAGPRPEGPVKLPAPPLRLKVPYIHGGELGLGGPMLKVTDDFVFAETDDLATAVLLEGKLYDLGRTVRLVIPDGAEARLGLDGTPVKLEGPMDLRLR